MNISELENAASKGFKLDDDFKDPTRSDMMAAMEIIDKAKDILSEIQMGRWDKDAIASKTTTIMWFAARIAGMYGINLEGALRVKADETAKSGPVLDKPFVRRPMLTRKGAAKWNKPKPRGSITGSFSARTGKPTTNSGT